MTFLLSPCCLVATQCHHVQAVLPGAPQAQTKSGTDPASAFGQLGSHCSWGQAAMRPQLQLALEELLSPLHGVTPLLLKPWRASAAPSCAGFGMLTTLPAQSHTESGGVPCDV